MRIYPFSDSPLGLPRTRTLSVLLLVALDPSIVSEALLPWACPQVLLHAPAVLSQAHTSLKAPPALQQTGLSSWTVTASAPAAAAEFARRLPDSSTRLSELVPSPYHLQLNLHQLLFLSFLLAISLLLPTSTLSHQSLARCLHSIHLSFCMPLQYYKTN